jgi:hypothetical protein
MQQAFSLAFSFPLICRDAAVFRVTQTLWQFWLRKRLTSDGGANDGGASPSAGDASDGANPSDADASADASDGPSAPVRA